MFQRILVPLDGSARAAQALPIAARIARVQRGSLVLLTVVPPVEALAWSELPPLSPQTHSAAQEPAAQELVRLASSALLTGLDVTRDVVEGQPAAAIVATAYQRHINLIVLGSHGRSGLVRHMLGSVAQHVARTSPAPVLVLREGAGGPINEQLSTRPLCIMLALDGSALAEQAVGPAAELGAALSAPLPAALHLVRVVPCSNDFDYGQDDAVAQSRREDLREARAYLDALQQRLSKEYPGLAVITSLAMSPDIARTLIACAETGAAAGMSANSRTSDLIALATHGRSGFARQVMGSIAERILGATRLPLFIVRPAQPPEQTQRGG